MSLIRILCIVMLACGLMSPLTAPAQPAGAKGDDFLYRVVRGDTLGELAQRYTLESSNWRALQQLNAVEDPYRLQIARLLRIPFSMIPLRESSAQVLHAVGQVSVDGGALHAASSVSEGQAVETGENGFVSLQLTDGSVVSVPPSTHLVISRLREFVGAGLTDSIIEMEAGSVETQVAPNQTGVGRFEVRTPVSVTGVRGTRMRVHAAAGGSRSEVVSGMAGVDGTVAPELVLRERQGVAIDPAGQSLGVRSLLPAPELSVPSRGPGGWSIDFEPLAGAAAYVVSVARDSNGGQLVSQRTIDSPPAQFAASGPGTHYVFVRGVDEAGIGGMDASAAFEGAYVLLDRSSNPISSAAGGLVIVADY
ncbi:FecR domain-containing protein [Pusillimonas sp.]|uniref:FecR domain-containing protein n=1 Tax=Pusillimonas sp. TaxID=3040095 RepID=UPI0037C7C575